MEEGERKEAEKKKKEPLEMSALYTRTTLHCNAAAARQFDSRRKPDKLTSRMVVVVCGGGGGNSPCRGTGRTSGIRLHRCPCSS